MVTADDIGWFKRQFRTQIEAALPGTPVDLDMIVAIACQETGYIWAVLRKKELPLDRVVALCVGDTIDFKGPGRGRQAFPRNKEALVAERNGQAMFDVARNPRSEQHDAFPVPSVFCVSRMWARTTPRSIVKRGQRITILVGQIVACSGATAGRP